MVCGLHREKLRAPNRHLLLPAAESEEKELRSGFEDLCSRLTAKTWKKSSRISRQQ